MTTPTPADELLPHLLYRVAGGQAEFATWQLTGGGPALALFLTAENATAYRAAAHPGEEWQVFQPPRAALVDILRESVAAGVRFAVLDPDATQAKRLWDLNEVLRNADAPAG